MTRHLSRTLPRRIMTTLTVTLVLLLPVLLLMVWLGGPKPPPPLQSIHEPFKGVDFSGVPTPSRFTARDGTSLAWLRYAPSGATPTGRRIVLVHGSSGRAQSMHVLARGLAAAGFEVASLDMRGHGDSGPRGHIAYIGQLEDDIADFMRTQPFAGPSTLLGFSSGGGFVLRLAGGEHGALFDRYLLLAPFLHHDAPTNRPSDGGWVSVGLPRIVALTALNTLHLTALNHLPVLRFALDGAVSQQLTAQYSYNLATNFRPRLDWAADLRAAQGDVRVLVGTEDELFRPERYADTFTQAGRALPVSLVPGTGHMGLTLQAEAVRAVATAAL